MIYELEDICKEEEKEEFTIQDDGTANWAISCIKEEEKEFERLCNGIDEQIEMLKNKKEQLQNQLNNKTSFLKGKLAEYFDGVDKKELKLSYKYKLAAGELVLVKPTVKYEHNDEQILQYLRDNDKFEYIQVEHKLKWQELKKNEDITKIDGVTAIPVEARFEVR